MLRPQFGTSGNKAAAIFTPNSNRDEFLSLLVLVSSAGAGRFTLVAELHPDWMLLLFFTHTHLTVTVTLGLLLIPKVKGPILGLECSLTADAVFPLHPPPFVHPQFLFAGTQMRDDIASEAYEDELDMGRSGSYLNSSITSAWSEHSLDPEDIRVGGVSVFGAPPPPKKIFYH